MRTGNTHTQQQQASLPSQTTSAVLPSKAIRISNNNNNGPKQKEVRYQEQYYDNSTVRMLNRINADRERKGQSPLPQGTPQSTPQSTPPTSSQTKQTQINTDSPIFRLSS